MHVFINPYVIKFRFSDVPICGEATEHSHGKNAMETLAKQCRAPRTGPDTSVAIFYVTNASDTVSREHRFMQSEYVCQRKAM